MSSKSSKTEEPPDNDLVLVGRVVRPHGVRGEVLVQPWSDVPGRFAPGASLTLTPAHGGRRTLRVATVRSHSHGAILRFEGVADRDAAEGLKGGELAVPRAIVPRPPAGSFYYFELVGCACRDRRAGELGRVSDLVEDGGGLLLAITDEKRTLLVPFVASYLANVDVDARKIELDLPDGLIEACESRS
ncbi:MAG TPA: ribosome maturation factor RimM [Thermoanaerobaculia bacterium]|nr:ribosome maturation factor RimM [Thermoanaerobaculia bacterium]